MYRLRREILTSTAKDQILRRSDEAVAMSVTVMLRVFSSTVIITDGETRYMCAYKQDLTGDWRETSHINLFACQKP
jgi:hypothetical protein